MNIASTVNLGAYTELSAGNDLSIAALIGSIYALASAYSETGSIINTQSRPTAEVNVTAKAWIRGTENVKLSAANLLSLVAATAENNNIYTKAYSYGFTAGGTGSVVSKQSTTKSCMARSIFWAISPSCMAKIFTSVLPHRARAKCSTGRKRSTVQRL